MTGTVIQFPINSVQPRGVRIPLYTDEEVALTTMAINAFSDLPHTTSTDELKYSDPVLVLECLRRAKHSNWFSSYVNNIFLKILQSVEYESE